MILWCDAVRPIRSLLATPVFTLTCIVTLSLGIGINAALFSVIEPLLLRKLAVPNPDDLTLIHSVGSLGTLDISERHFLDHYRHRLDLFEGVSAFSSLGEIEVVRSGRDLSAQGELVTPNYFSVLGLDAHVGRLFAEADIDDPSIPPVIVLSFDYWSRSFNADPSVVGTVLTVGNRPRFILGVTPPRFFGAVVGRSPDFYVPISPTDPSPEWLTIFARLKRGVAVGKASLALDPLFRQAADASSASPVERSQLMARLLLTPMSHGITAVRPRDVRSLRLMGILTTFVFAIAALNLACLLLIRNAARARDFVLRAALGARWFHIVAHPFIEAAWIAVLGSLCAMILGKWLGTLPLLALSTEESQIILSVVSIPALGVFCFCAMLLSTLVAGGVPAFILWRVGLARNGNATLRGHGSGRLSHLLTVVQVAGSTAVLIASALLLRSFINLKTADLGVARDQIASVSIGSSAVHKSAIANKKFYARLVDRVQELPGVQSVAISQLGIMTGAELGINVTVDGVAPLPPEASHVFFNKVSPGYFRTMGIPIIAGRDFDPADEKRASVAVINRTMARHFFGAANPIGRQIRFVEGRRPPMEVIGVVSDIVYNDIRERTPAFLYLHSWQSSSQSVKAVLNIRTRTIASESLSLPVMKIVKRLDDSRAVANLTSLRTQVEKTLHHDRSIMAVCWTLSVLTFVISCVGIYATLSWQVFRRTREIGVRMAVGAAPRQIIWLVAREVTRLVALGTLLGGIASAVTSRFMSGVLFRVSPADPVAIVLAVTVTFSVGLLAAWGPSHRASRVDPAVSLRHN